jgi:hypothetical protein
MVPLLLLVERVSSRFYIDRNVYDISIFLIHVCTAVYYTKYTQRSGTVQAVGTLQQ